MTQMTQAQFLSHLKRVAKVKRIKWTIGPAGYIRGYSRRTNDTWLYNFPCCPISALPTLEGGPPDTCHCWYNAAQEFKVPDALANKVIAAADCDFSVSGATQLRKQMLEIFDLKETYS